MHALRTILVTVTACLGLSAAVQVSATPVSFDVTSSTFIKGSGYGSGGPGLLDVDFSANGLAQVFSLDLGQAFSFDFGSITLQESVAILAGETDNLGVAAIFNFADPLNGLKSVTATGTATVGLLADTDIDFSIDWAPVLVDFGNGGLFSISMDTVNFRQSGASQTQTATIRLLANSVPEPASLALVGVAFAGLVLVGGRRQRGRMPAR